ncbi:hypothetical protein QR680_018594 [Steinernema hermaphroditum]|uniref:Uncharacterized protein n=1 Tax=Steinernema hermaphroditum TaxID=289476 RepID=A0AA39HIG5_9BILA|nr:hypothetical protein QR680_018594 [Steinernema hermaphroditum]
METTDFDGKEPGRLAIESLPTVKIFRMAVRTTGRPGRRQEYIKNWRENQTVVTVEIVIYLVHSQSNALPKGPALTFGLGALNHVVKQQCVWKLNRMPP